MSKVIESFRVKYPLETVKAAIRMVAMRTASAITEQEMFFTVKYKMRRTLLSSSTPATIMIEFKESKKVENATVLKLTSANLGIGPLQVRECRLKLDGLKEALLLQLEAIEKFNEESAAQELAAQALAAQALADQSGGKDTHFKFRKLKRRHYRAGGD